MSRLNTSRLTLFALPLLALAAPAAAQGCGPGLQPGENIVPVTSGGATRQVLVHLPTGYDGRTRMPLVLNLHGSGSRGAEQLKSSGMAATADRHGFIVAAPDAGIPVNDGKGFVWNIPGVPTIAGEVPGPNDADDVTFVASLIDTLAARACVDRTRVYSTGLSGGGRMSSWLGCALSERIAAIAPVVGLRAGRARTDDLTQVDDASCAPANPMPVMAFSGGADRTNPNAGGEGARWGYSLDAAVARWATINGCGPALPRYHRAADVTVDARGGCNARSELVSVIDTDGGHNWTVADNDAMWAFFARHRREGATR